MNLGPYSLRNNVFVAPMAGVTDRPFRQLCKQLGAGYAVSEMAASNPRLWQSEKSARRTNHDGEMEPKAVQIAGADPAMLAECARHNVERGAQIIDINMGCPVKKVCNNWCGSALLQDEALVGRILDAVVAAVDVPVTLKFRTGWDRLNKNALTIARMAETAGIAMLTLHGRTRADGYSGEAEYETIAAVKAAVKIPVVANGDIDTPEKARQVLDATGADAVMIGRAAQGRPWIFREIAHYLRNRHPSAGADGGRGTRAAGGTFAGALRFLWRIPRGAHRAQAYRLVCARAAGRGGIPPPHEPAGRVRRAAGGAGSLFRSAGGVWRAVTIRPGCQLACGMSGGEFLISTQ